MIFQHLKCIMVRGIHPVSNLVTGKGEITSQKPWLAIDIEARG
jgi:hypothetical protein